MSIKNIRILDEITDIENDSIDVCVDSILKIRVLTRILKHTYYD